MTSDLLATLSKFPQQLTKAIESTQKRKDVWASREEARNWMKEREPYNRWDPQVLDLFIVSSNNYIESRACTYSILVQSSNTASEIFPALTIRKRVVASH